MSGTDPPYPIPPTTSNHELPLIPPAGDVDAENFNGWWGHIQNDMAWSNIERKLIARDTIANRPDYEPYDDAFFWATDSGALYIGDGSSWSEFFDGSGTSGGGGGGSGTGVWTLNTSTAVLAESAGAVSVGVPSLTVRDTVNSNAATLTNNNGALELDSPSRPTMYLGIGKGPLSARPNTGVHDNELYLDTDDNTLYRWDDAQSSWTKTLSDKLGVKRGPLSARPSPGTYDSQLYLATDEETLYVWSESKTSWSIALDQTSGLNRGPLSARPTTSNTNNELYLATDKKTLYRWDNAAGVWEVGLTNGTGNGGMGLDDALQLPPRATAPNAPNAGGKLWHGTDGTLNYIFANGTEVTIATDGSQ